MKQREIPAHLKATVTTVMERFEAGQEELLAIPWEVSEMHIEPKEAFDFKTADPKCKKCFGRGIYGYQTIENNRIAIVCKCVKRVEPAVSKQADPIKELLTASEPGPTLMTEPPEDSIKKLLFKKF